MNSSQTYLRRKTTCNANLCSDRFSRLLATREALGVSGIPWGVSLTKFTVESKQLEAGFPLALSQLPQ